jgi:DNA-binding winged helix-turn-helix (wHTH) protein
MGAGVLAGQQQTLPLAGAEGWSKIFASSGTGMTTRTREGTRHRFGAFVVDVRASELLKSGKKIKVQLQPMQVLAALLEQPGEIVTRDELRKRIWPEDTFVDFEHSLNTAVKKLRQALGDRASKSKYIETLPRRGYRFLPEVEASESKTGMKPAVSSRLAGKVFELVAEEGTGCVVAPADEKAFEEWERLTRLKDDVGVSIMITDKRLLLLEAGNQVRLLGVEKNPGLCEVRILEGEHYGKTALVPRKALRTYPKQPR